jgi:hypothetical protein
MALLLLVLGLPGLATPSPLLLVYPAATFPGPLLPLYRPLLHPAHRVKPEVQPVLVEVEEGYDCQEEGTFPIPEDCTRCRDRTGRKGK